MAVFPLYSLIQHGYAVALWRLPQTSDIHAIADLSRAPHICAPQLETSPAGFWISPFSNENLAHTHFIRADWQARKAGEMWELPEGLPTEILNQTPDFQTIRAGFLPTPRIAYSTQEAHEKLVSKGIETIEAGEMQKLVISRAKSIPYPANFDMLESFEKLCRTYPTAFCYCFHLPAVGTWMGATPETLIEMHAGKVFKTVALAGTQAYKGQAVRDALWSQKEIEEQALVSRYIINCFKKIRVREFEELGPKTVIAGHLMHLQTYFSADIEEAGHPELGTEMLQLLHPTSAVCGMPKPPAQAFLAANEGYDRQFYSGFLGASDRQGATHLFVNLRCMQLTCDGLTLYAGGGITIDSVPEKEWQETELKMQIMEKILQG